MESIVFSDHCFNGEKLSFLSNFYPMKILYKTNAYASAEHLFQTAKCLHKKDRDLIRAAATPKLARIRGFFVKAVRSDWDSLKIGVMKAVLHQKFKRSKLRKLLCETGSAPIIQLNNIHDTFWGVCACTRHKRDGENILGELLMEVREEINKEMQTQLESGLEKEVVHNSLALPSKEND